MSRNWEFCPSDGGLWSFPITNDSIDDGNVLSWSLALTCAIFSSYAYLIMFKKVISRLVYFVGFNPLQDSLEEVQGCN